MLPSTNPQAPVPLQLVKQEMSPTLRRLSITVPADMCQEGFHSTVVNLKKIVGKLPGGWTLWCVHACFRERGGRGDGGGGMEEEGMEEEGMEEAAKCFGGFALLQIPLVKSQAPFKTHTFSQTHTLSQTHSL